MTSPRVRSTISGCESVFVCLCACVCVFVCGKWAGGAQTREQKWNILQLSITIRVNLQQNRCSAGSEECKKTGPKLVLHIHSQHLSLSLFFLRQVFLHVTQNDSIFVDLQRNKETENQLRQFENSYKILLILYNRRTLYMYIISTFRSTDCINKHK